MNTGRRKATHAIYGKKRSITRRRFNACVRDDSEKDGGKFKAVIKFEKSMVKIATFLSCNITYPDILSVMLRLFFQREPKETLQWRAVDECYFMSGVIYKAKQMCLAICRQNLST